MEYRRILLDIRIIAIIIVLIFAGWFSFYNAINAEDDEFVIPDVEEEMSYAQQYAKYLDETVDRTGVLMKRAASDVKKAKLQRTADDFNRLKSVTITEGNDETLTNVYEFGNASYILIIIGAVLSFSFLGERKRGMWWYVHASKRGRTSLSVRRLCLLFLVNDILAMEVL